MRVQVSARDMLQCGPEGNHSREVATELSPVVLPSAADPTLMAIFSPMCARKEAELADDPLNVWTETSRAAPVGSRPGK